MRPLPIQRRAGLGHRTVIQYPILTRRSGPCPLGGAGRSTCWVGSQDAVGDRNPASPEGRTAPLLCRSASYQRVERSSQRVERRRFERGGGRRRCRRRPAHGHGARGLQGHGGSRPGLTEPARRTMVRLGVERSPLPRTWMRQAHFGPLRLSGRWSRPGRARSRDPRRVQA